MEEPGALAHNVGEQAQLELVDQVEPHQRPPEADAAPDHDVAVAAPCLSSISSEQPQDPRGFIIRYLKSGPIVLELFSWQADARRTRFWLRRDSVP